MARRAYASMLFKRRQTAALGTCSGAPTRVVRWRTGGFVHSRLYGRSNHAYAHNTSGSTYSVSRDRGGDPARNSRTLEGAWVFHNHLGLASEHLGRLADAASAYQRAVDLKPNHAMARLSLTRVNAQLQPAFAATTLAPPLDSVSSAAATAPKP